MARYRIMRVCQILYSGLGGQGNVSFSLVEGDSEKKINFSFIFCGIEKILPEYISFCKENKYPWNYIPKQKGLDFFSWIKIFLSLKKNKIDTILLHSPTLLIPCLIYSFIFKKKIVLVEHTPNLIKSKKDSFFSLFSFLFSQKTVLLSNEYQKELEKKNILYYIFKKKIKIIPNGISFQKIEKEKVPIDQDLFSITMTGRFTSQKKFSSLIQAFELFLKEKNFPIKTKLFLIGNGENLEKCKKYVQENNLENHVFFLGYLKEKELLKYLWKSKIYVQYSKSETMSISLLEGMFTQNIILGSKVNGIQNILKDKSLGEFFESKKELSGKLIYYYENEKEIENISKEIQKKAISKFSAEKMFQNYFQEVFF